MEVKLKEKDYRTIEEYALRDYLEKSPKPKQVELFVCQCYVKAIVDYLSSQKYTIKNGKVVKE